MKANLVKAMGVIATVASVAGAPLMTFAAEGSNSPIPALAAEDLVAGVEIANGEKLVGTVDKDGNITSLEVLKADGYRSFRNSLHSLNFRYCNICVVPY